MKRTVIRYKAKPEAAEPPAIATEQSFTSVRSSTIAMGAEQANSRRRSRAPGASLRHHCRPLRRSRPCSPAGCGGTRAVPGRARRGSVLPPGRPEPSTAPSDLWTRGGRRVPVQRRWCQSAPPTRVVFLVAIVGKPSLAPASGVFE